MSNDVIYYNLTIGNNDLEKAGNLLETDIPANINALNTIPIIQNPSDYYASIIRFQIPALTLPLVNVLIQTPVADINKTIYSFTIEDLSNNTFSQQNFVMWEAQVQDTTIPQVGTSTQTLSEYYLCYSYNWFIDLWNKALLQCLIQIGATANMKYCYFKYDATTQLISLFASKEFNANLTNTQQYKIWINNPFLTYFNGMEKVNVNQSPISNALGCDNYLIPRQWDKEDAFQTPFEFSSYGYWNFLKSIIITTTMNVDSEAVFNNNSNLGATNVNYINILEDYYPDLATQQSAGVQSQIFTYTAQSLYRIFTFKQLNPLYKIDLGVSIVDSYGNIFPLLLPKGQLANFKIMFIKKSVYATMPKLLN